MIMRKPNSRNVISYVRIQPNFFVALIFARIFQGAIAIFHWEILKISLFPWNFFHCVKISFGKGHILCKISKETFFIQFIFSLECEEYVIRKLWYYWSYKSKLEIDTSNFLKVVDNLFDTLYSKKSY